MPTSNHHRPTTTAEECAGDQAFWLVVYRSLLAIAQAIKRYKLRSGAEADDPGPGV